MAAAAPSGDEFSFAQPDVVRIKHLALDLDVDFRSHVVSGSATLSVTWLDPSARELVLDSRDLSITKVEAWNGEWRSAPYELAPSVPIYGNKLTIHLARPAQRIRVTYSTSPDAAALQWLSPQMTLGKRAPFLFSQSESLEARSWIPLQDRPDIRFTYSARIRTPKDLVALMSASNDSSTKRTGDYRFYMPQPIPSYLLALAVGDLAFRPISDRIGIWSEPELVDRAQREFADTARMMSVAEELYGPYRWGRFDILVAPPSFPLGGMENPRLTFLTPTAIVGDKSLVSVAAHELAHSWSGNLVTQRSWKDIWLNEGFTTYVQSRIVEAVYGRSASEMEDVIDQRGLVDALKMIPLEDQVLAQKNYAEDWLSLVPYVKGKWFLEFLEQRFGRAELDAFLRHWFESHAFQSVSSSDFETSLLDELVARHPDRVSTSELEQWLHEPGLPATASLAKSEKLALVEADARRWQAREIAASSIDTGAWRTQQWVIFIQSLGAVQDPARLAELDSAFHFTGTSNGEIAQRWYPLTVGSGYLAARPAMAEFLVRVGRPKLIRPVYAALAATQEGTDFGQSVFDRAKPTYHPNAVKAIEKVMANGWRLQQHAAPAVPG